MTPSTADIDQPLSLRMRPRRLEDFAGQEDIVGPGTVLRLAIQEDTLSSAIFWGPPGCGKTTLAEIIAELTKAEFVKVSAVTAKVSDVRAVIAAARERQKGYGRRTIMLLDEVHRFNKAQQDTLLPAVEDGSIILIGTTTENPYFEVNSALISRSRVFQLTGLSDSDLSAIANRALKDKDKGLGREKIRLDKPAEEHLVKTAGGDARSLLNGLEAAAIAARTDAKGIKRITLEIAEDAMQRRALLYDMKGEAHYDVASAFIKSMRGSDPQAAVYWLAVMIYGGEDPKFIARRMIIFASEDVGNADPMALVVATAAAQAVQNVGLPEARINLSQAAIYLAAAPKSNASYLAIDAALKDVAKGPQGAPPKHVRNAPHPGMKEHGYGVGYKYPHNFPGHVVDQDYLPPELKGREYYKPSGNGAEALIKKRLETIKYDKIKPSDNESGGKPGEGADET
jgi:putative ATPase